MQGSSSLYDYFEDSTSVLLLAPTFEEPDDSACIDLLTPDAPRDENVLSVTVSAIPDERLAVWQRHVGDTLPKRAAIVAAGSPATEGDQIAASDEFPSITVDFLADPPDPLELGVTIGEYVGSWEPTPERTLVCFHSVTKLLEDLDRSVLFQFVSALNARFARMDAVAHYHLDPAAHDDQIIAELRPLFDVVVEHGPDGEWTVGTAAPDEEVPLYRNGGSGKAAERGSLGRTAVADQPPLPSSFDTVLDLLSARIRRYALYQIVDRPGERLPLDEIVDRICECEAKYPGRGEPPSRSEIESTLVHSHLPRLDETGIVAFDAADRSVYYRTNPGIEACIEHARAIERR